MVRQNTDLTQLPLELLLILTTCIRLQFEASQAVTVEICLALARLEVVSEAGDYTRIK